jgi:hypothetical protein
MKKTETVVKTRSLLDRIYKTLPNVVVDIQGTHESGYTLTIVMLGGKSITRCRTRGELNASLRTLLTTGPLLQKPEQRSGEMPYELTFLNLDSISLPSKKYLLELYCNRGFDGDAKKCQEAWDIYVAKVSDLRKRGRLAATACLTIDQMLADIQTACYLESEDNIGTMLYAQGKL